MFSLGSCLTYTEIASSRCNAYGSSFEEQKEMLDSMLHMFTCSDVWCITHTNSSSLVVFGLDTSDIDVQYGMTRDIITNTTPIEYNRIQHDRHQIQRLGRPGHEPPALEIIPPAAPGKAAVMDGT